MKPQIPLDAASETLALAFGQFSVIWSVDHRVAIGADNARFCRTLFSWNHLKSRGAEKHNAPGISRLIGVIFLGDCGLPRGPAFGTFQVLYPLHARFHASFCPLPARKSSAREGCPTCAEMSVFAQAEKPCGEVRLLTF